MFFVEARYHRSPERAAGQVRYIAHREEGLTDGRPRELCGIGERYRAFGGDERDIRRALRDDARGLRSPVYFRFILTVDNPAAERFKWLDGRLSPRGLRDAIDKAFRGTLREAQGDITGEVRSPGAFFFAPGITVRQAIGMAGGLTPDGSSSRLRVVRTLGGKSKELKIGMDDAVRPGDTIVVKAKLF